MRELQRAMRRLSRRPSCSLRRSLTKPRCIAVDYSAIVNGRVPELRLQPRDIVYGPGRPLGLLDNAGRFMMNSFGRTVAANEGVRAGGGTEKVGVGVIVGN